MGTAAMAAAIVTAYPEFGIGLAQKIAETADSVGCHPFDLANVIRAESKGNPAARNPGSDASGLIGAMPKTAAALGLTTAQIRAMSAIDQMDRVVKPYLQMVASGRWAGPAGPLNTLQALALSVFYPAWRYMPADTVFPVSVQKANPGINKVGDYTAFVMRYARLPSSATVGWAADTAGKVRKRVPIGLALGLGLGVGGAALLLLARR